MTITIERARARLEAKQAELRAHLNTLAAVSPSADSWVKGSRDVQDREDVAAEARAIEEEQSISESQRRLLADVEGALERIRQGTYGLCVQCHRPLPEKRLEVLPWAARDISCQQQFEMQNSENIQALPIRTKT
jgi:DnaK suppressor protein